MAAVDADSGYYAGDAIGRLLTSGLDLCVPDSNTACDLHRGQPVGTTRALHCGSVEFTYDEQSDCFRCPEGNELRRRQTSHDTGNRKTNDYRAIRCCQGCPQAPQCLTRPEVRHRTLKISEYHAILQADLQRFDEPEHQGRYHHRSDVVETVFGFLRGTLGYTRWLLRGEKKVACEESAVPARLPVAQGTPALGGGEPMTGRGVAARRTSAPRERRRPTPPRAVGASNSALQCEDPPASADTFTPPPARRPGQGVDDTKGQVLGGLCAL